MPTDDPLDLQLAGAEADAAQWRRIAAGALDLAGRVRPSLDAAVSSLSPQIWTGPAALRTRSAAHEHRLAVWAAADTLEHQAEIAERRAADADAIAARLRSELAFAAQAP